MWANHSAATRMFYIAQEMSYDIGNKIVPLYFIEYLITAVFENDKNSVLYKSELLKTPQSIAWWGARWHSG